MTAEDVEQVAARLYELATIKHLPPESAKQHMAEVLRNLVGVAAAGDVMSERVSTAQSLEPCPFCRAEARTYFIDEGHETWGGRDRHGVGCTRCPATVEDEAEEEARAAWNRRVTSS